MFRQTFVVIYAIKKFLIQPESFRRPQSPNKISYAERVQFSPQLHIYFTNIHFNIILLSFSLTDLCNNITGEVPSSVMYLRKFRRELGVSEEHNISIFKVKK
jgi:hypothetical protein